MMGAFWLYGMMKYHVLLVFAVFLTGCFHTSAQSRLGDVVAAGHVSAGVQVDVASLAFGEVDGETQWWGARSYQHPLMMMAFPMFMSQGFLNVGLGNNIEIGATLGVQELGGELRYGLTQQPVDGDDGISAAISVGAGWRPFMVDDFPHMQAGIDISKRYDTLAPHVNLYVTYGPQFNVTSGPSFDCKSFSQPGCGEYSPSKQYGAARRELRLQTAVGLTILTREAVYTRLANGDYAYVEGDYDGNTFDIGIAPWFTLDRQNVDGCFSGNCELFIPWAGDTPEFGAHLLFRYQFFPY